MSVHLIYKAFGKFFKKYILEFFREFCCFNRHHHDVLIAKNRPYFFLYIS